MKIGVGVDPTLTSWTTRLTLYPLPSPLAYRLPPTIYLYLQKYI
jgi:hypothetical protein